MLRLSNYIYLQKKVSLLYRRLLASVCPHYQFFASVLYFVQNKWHYVLRTARKYRLFLFRPYPTLITFTTQSR